MIKIEKTTSFKTHQEIITVDLDGDRIHNASIEDVTTARQLAEGMELKMETVLLKNKIVETEIYS